MRIAVCFSGNLRTVRDCYESHYNNVLKIFNPDVFFHTWDSVESKTKSWHNKHMKNKSVDDKLISFIENKYLPKNIIIDRAIDFNLNSYQIGTKIELNGLKSMTYSIMKSFKMANEYSDYDYFIKIRPDIMINDNFLKLPTDCNINLYGNKKNKPLFFKKQDVNYGALDCLFVYNNEKNTCNPFQVFDQFEKFYCRDRFFHSPFLDYLIFNNSNFRINKEVVYGKDWIIKRSSQ